MTDAGGHERIGPTAHYTAYVWHRLRLPYAEHFKTRTGRILYWGFFALGEWTTRVVPDLPSMKSYLAYRHRLIEAVVEEEAPDRLVEVGAGLSRRAVTWAADRGVSTFELDLPAMAGAKRRLLSRVPQLQERMGGRHTIEEVDVTSPDFAMRLAAMLDGASRPVVVAEGLLSYLAPPLRARMLAGVAQGLRAAGGGLLVCDAQTAAAQAEVGRAAAVLRTAIRILTRRGRALSGFADAADLEASLQDAGFDEVAIVQATDHVARDPQLAGLHSPASVVAARVR